jgi:hypothetical protein
VNNDVMGGYDMLRNQPVSTAKEIHYLTRSEAQMKWGSRVQEVIHPDHHQITGGEGQAGADAGMGHCSLAHVRAVILHCPDLYGWWRFRSAAGSSALPFFRFRRQPTRAGACTPPMVTNAPSLRWRT